MRQYPWVLGTLFLLARFSGCLAPEITVPDLAGMSQADATAALTAARLTLGEVKPQFDGNIPAGSVVSQDPAAGSRACVGTAVNLVVSAGPVPVPVPDLSGMTQADAQSTLTAAGLSLGTVSDAYSNIVTAGLVISQDPAANASVLPGTAVNLTLSKGPQPIAVPDVSGMTQTAAESALTAAGLSLGTISEAYSNNLAAGLVISQEPAANASVAPGTAVNLTLSKGPQLIAVPDVAGRTVDEALALLSEAGLVPGGQTHAYSATVAAGLVIGANPASGTLVALDTAVVLIVSQGPEPIAVPNVVGMRQEDAEVTLAANTLSVADVTTRFDDNILVGYVIAQEPAAGDHVPPLTPVRLVVSLGPSALVPDVVGMPQLDAERLLEQTLLTVGQIDGQYNVHVPIYNVISQDPLPGATVARSSAVNLVVSLGPEALPIPNVVGLTKDEAVAALAALQFSLGEITEQFFLDAEPGRIMQQDPAAGVVTLQTTPVNVVVAAEPKEVTVPDLVGMLQLSKTPLVEFVGHTDAITSIAFAEPGLRMVTGSKDGTAKLWDSWSGRLLMDFTGYDKPVTANIDTYANRVLLGSGNRVEVRSTEDGSLKQAYYVSAGEVTSVTFLSNELRVLAGSTDGTATVWYTNGSGTIKYTGHTGAVNAVAAKSPLSPSPITASDDGTVKVWSSSSSNLSQTLLGHTAPVTSVASTYNFYVSGSLDKTARTWSSEYSGFPKLTLQHPDDVYAVAAFGPVGWLTAWVLTGARDNAARLWHAKTGALLCTYPSEDSVRAVAFSGNNDPYQRAVAGSDDGNVKMWLIGTDAQAALDSSGLRLGTVQYEVDGSKTPGSVVGQSIAAGTTALQGTTVNIMIARPPLEVVVPNVVGFSREDADRILEDTLLQRNLVTVRYHTSLPINQVYSQNPPAGSVVGPYTRVNIEIGGEPQYVEMPNLTGVSLTDAESTLDELVLTWTVTRAYSTEPAETVIAQDPAAGIDIMQGSTVALTVSLGPQPVVPDVSNKTLADATADLVAARVKLGVVTYDVDARVALGCVIRQNPPAGTPVDPDTPVDLVLSGAVVPSVVGLGQTLGVPWLVSSLHDAPVNAVAVSLDGSMAVSGSDDTTAKLWDTRTGNLFFTFSGHSQRVNAVALSPDGARIATGSDDSTAKIWDINIWGKLHDLSGHSGSVLSVAFSADGLRVMTGASDTTARIWDVDTGALVVTLSGHGGPVTSVAFSHDGARALTASMDMTARLWNAETGVVLGAYTGSSYWLTSAAFSPDESVVAAGAGNGIVWLWDTDTFTPRGTLTGHSDTVTALAFSPDGKTLATASVDKTVKLWDVAGQTLILSLSGHADAVRSVAYFSDGAYIVSASADKTCAVWDARNDAAKALGNAGLTLGTLTLQPNSHVLAGIVFEQDPPAGAVVEPGKPAALTISHGL